MSRLTNQTAFVPLGTTCGLNQQSIRLPRSVGTICAAQPPGIATMNIMDSRTRVAALVYNGYPTLNQAQQIIEVINNS